MSEAAQPVFSIEKIYVKDLSLEVPNSPQCFLERETPTIDVSLQNASTQVGDGIFDVALTVTVTATIGEKTHFLVEAAQAGIFIIQNVPEADLEPILAVACPNILFPFARETVADAIARAGFPQMMLAPVNFEALYMQKRMEQQQSSGPHEIPIQ